MEANEKKYGKELVVEDGHPASLRNADGSMKNIYADDGNLTELGTTVMMARETLSKETHNEENVNKERKRNRKLITWAASAIAIVLFLLFFHISLVTAYEWSGLPKIYPKATPTFSNTFITPDVVNDAIKRYNNASIFEQISIKEEPFVKLLFDKGILYDIEGGNEQQKPQNNSYNEEQTENYNYYYYGESGEWEAFKVKIIFEKKDIKVVATEETKTFIISGSPKYDRTEGCTIYNVYHSSDVNKKYIREITRCKDQTIIVYESESGEYEIFSKNKPEYY